MNWIHILAQSEKVKSLPTEGLGKKLLLLLGFFIIFCIVGFLNQKEIENFLFSSIHKNNIKVTFDGLGRRGNASRNIIIWASLMISLCPGSIIIMGFIKKIHHQNTRINFFLQSIDIWKAVFFVILSIFGFLAGIYLYNFHIDHQFSRDANSNFFPIADSPIPFSSLIRDLRFFLWFGFFNIALLPLLCWGLVVLKKKLIGAFPLVVLLLASLYFIFLIDKFSLWNIEEILIFLVMTLSLSVLYYFLISLVKKIPKIKFKRGKSFVYEGEDKYLLKIYGKEK